MAIHRCRLSLGTIILILAGALLPTSAQQQLPGLKEVSLPGCTPGKTASLLGTQDIGICSDVAAYFTRPVGELSVLFVISNLPALAAEIATFGDSAILTLPSVSTVVIVNSIGNYTILEVPCLTADSPGTMIVADKMAYIACSGGKIAIVSASGQLKTYQIPLPSGAYVGPPSAFNFAAGADGNVWFTQTQPTNAQGQQVFDGKERIGRITPQGVISSFDVPSMNAGTKQSLVAAASPIAAGADGNIWVIEPNVHKILRVTINGLMTEFPIATQDPLIGIAAGADGNIWVHEAHHKFHRVTPSGMVSSFTLPNSDTSTDANLILAWTDASLWFQEDNKVGRISTTGMITEFALPSAQLVYLAYLHFFPNGYGSFVEFLAKKVATFQAPEPVTPLLSAVLPASRSVQVGTPATAFATLINSGQTALTGCKPAMLPGPYATFSYQTTDPATNALTGTGNTPANIPAGGSQSFVFAYTPLAPFNPIDAKIGFSCTEAAAAGMVSGLNTLLLSASATPKPDILALAATTTNDGTLHIPGSNGSAAFAVATTNKGAGATITAKAFIDSGLPVTITICETDPKSGACKSNPAASVTTTIDTDATPTFGIFVTANGPVPFLPTFNRVRVVFLDADGVVRGSTSVAVTTQ